MSSSVKKTLAREYALKFLYHLQLKDFSHQKEALLGLELDDAIWSDYLTEFDQTYNEPDGEHPDNQLDDASKRFALQLISGTLNNNEQLLENIKTHLDRENLERVNSIDLTILCLGAFELLNIEETPQKVAINEAINLAKKFGSEGSSAFINGVLDGIARS